MYVILAFINENYFERVIILLNSAFFVLYHLLSVL